MANCFDRLCETLLFVHTIRAHTKRSDRDQQMCVSIKTESVGNLAFIVKRAHSNRVSVRVLGKIFARSLLSPNLEEKLFCLFVQSQAKPKCKE